MDLQLCIWEFPDYHRFRSFYIFRGQILCILFELIIIFRGQREWFCCLAVGDVFLLVHDACGLTRVTRQLFASRRLALREYEGQGVSYQVLEEWTRVGVGSAILPESKLSAPGLGHPIVLGNGHRASIRFEAVWMPATAPAPHLQSLTQHLKSAGAALAQKEHT